MAGGGKLLKKIGNLGGSVLNPGNVVGSVVGSLGGVGEVIGPAIQLGAGANPLGVFGASLGSKVLQSYTDAGGDTRRILFIDSNGNPVYATPGADYGSTTYSLGKKALDADPYFIEGSKGIYNLLPELAKVYGDKPTARLEGTSSYNVYQTIYDRMAEDALAQQRLAERYGPKTLDLGWSRTKTLDPTLARLKSNKIGGYDFTYARDTQLPSYLMNDLRRTAKEREAALLATLPSWDPTKFENRQAYNAARQAAITGYNPEDMQYVDWGFGSKATKKSPWEAVATYAAKRNNPFFIAFDPNTGQTVATPAEGATTAGTTTGTATTEGKAAGGIVDLMRNKTRFGKE